MTQRKVAEAFPPGEFIQEELDERGWSQIVLSEIIGCHPTIVNAWVKGKRGITPQSAKQLGDAFGTSAQLWMNLQASYDLWKIGTVDDGIAKRAKVYGYGPVKDLSRRQWLEPSENIEVLEKRLLKFYGTSNLDEKPQMAYAARKSTSGDLTPAQLAWLFRAKHLARCITANHFTEYAFKEALRSLRALMSNVEDIRLVSKVLAQFGIKFVVIEPLSIGSGIDGVTFWQDEGPIIAMSLRFDRIDSFWFTLGHELGHIKNGDGKDGVIIIDIDLEAQPVEEKSHAEKMADAFAGEFIVPQDKLESFIQRKGPLFSENKINAFAKLHGVHPGMVVGQLQHRGCFHWSHYTKTKEKIRDIVKTSALTDGWGQIPIGA